MLLLARSIVLDSLNALKLWFHQDPASQKLPVNQLNHALQAIPLAAMSRWRLRHKFIPPLVRDLKKKKLQFLCQSVSRSWNYVNPCAVGLWATRQRQSFVFAAARPQLARGLTAPIMRGLPINRLKSGGARAICLRPHAALKKS